MGSPHASEKNLRYHSLKNDFLGAVFLNLFNS